MITDSLSIILKQFKEGHITEEEAIRLIDDLYYRQPTFVPTFPQWPQPSQPLDPWYKEWRITCTNDVK